MICFIRAVSELRFLVLAALVAAIAFQGTARAGIIESLGLAGSRATQFVLLIDRSASVSDDDRKLYAASTKWMIERMRNGDSVVVGILGDRGLGRFTADLQLTVPASGRHYRDVSRLEQSRQDVLQAVERLLVSTAPAGRTRIVEGLAALNPVFANARRQQRQVELLLLTDGLEDSSVARFDAMRWNASDAGRLMKKVREQQLLVEIRGNVYVIGGGGSTIALTQGAQQFWTEYFRASGATLVQYGRTLPHAPLDGRARLHSVRPGQTAL